jgi:hypothetical protein
MAQAGVIRFIAWPQSTWPAGPYLRIDSALATHWHDVLCAGTILPGTSTKILPAPARRRISSDGS